MRLFENTMAGLESYLHEQKRRSSSNLLNGLNEGRSLTKGIVNLSASGTKAPIILEFDETELKKYFSPSPQRFETITIGDHPDFKHIDHHSTEYNYAVSMFIDIKGSTRLIEIVDGLEELRRIKDTILTLAIHVVNFFGGHIQRMQGDAVFAVFCRKGGDPLSSCVGALNAASVLSQFIKNEFSEAIKSMGLEKSISIRTGIDIGADHEVLWSRYGIPECGELTTTSVHTDMAAKLQQHAPKNGVMIGDNVREIMDMDESLYSIKSFIEDGERKLIPSLYPSTKMSYNMHVFDWEKFLCTYSFARRDSDSYKVVFNQPQKRLQCIITNTNTEYFENSSALDKGLSLKFTILDRTGNPLTNYPHQKMEWKIINTGKEAAEQDSEVIPLEVTDQYATSVTVDTSYLGQHKIQCKVRNSSGYGYETTLEFSVFVKK